MMVAQLAFELFDEAQDQKRDYWNPPYQSPCQVHARMGCDKVECGACSGEYGWCTSAVVIAHEGYNPYKHLNHPYTVAALTELCAKFGYGYHGGDLR